MKYLTIALTLLGVAGCSRPATNLGQAAGEKPARHEAARRLVYPYSVVPGGVHDRREVLEAVSRDTVTAKHYAGIDTATLRPALLDRDTRAYVSFRKHGQVFWTRNTVLLTKGETILTNGKDCLRGRCGNRVSLKPQKPVLGEGDREPSTAMLNTPQTANGTVLDEAIPELPVAGMESQLPVQLPLIGAPAESGSPRPGVAGVMPLGPQAWGPGPAVGSVGSPFAPPGIPFVVPTQKPGSLPGLTVATPADPTFTVVSFPSSIGAPGFTAPTAPVPSSPLVFVTTPLIPERGGIVVPPSFLTVALSFTSSTSGPPNGGTTTQGSVISPPPADGGSPPPIIELKPPSPPLVTEGPCCTTGTVPAPPSGLQPVPEPATVLLLGAGLAATLIRWRRRTLR